MPHIREDYLKAALHSVHTTGSANYSKRYYSAFVGKISNWFTSMVDTANGLPLVLFKTKCLRDTTSLFTINQGELGIFRKVQENGTLLLRRCCGGSFAGCLSNACLKGRRNKEVKALIDKEATTVHFSPEVNSTASGMAGSKTFHQCFWL